MPLPESLNNSFTIPLSLPLSEQPHGSITTIPSNSVSSQRQNNTTFLTTIPLFSVPLVTFSIDSSPLITVPSSPTFSTIATSESLPTLAPSLSPFTRKLAKEIRSNNSSLQEASLDLLSLLALLFAANSPEPAEPKSYKEAVSEENFHRKNYLKAMQEEIDSVNANETWILTDLPVGWSSLNGKWVYKVKRGLGGEIF